MTAFLRLPSLLVMAALIAACSAKNSGAAPASLGPRVLGAASIVANPNAAAPLTAIVSLTTDVPSQVELDITDGTHSWSSVADSSFRTVHDRVPVLGMRPAHDHTITIMLRDQAGHRLAAPDVLHFTTPALMADFPPMQVTASQPERMERGITLLTIFANPGSFLVMLDAAGEVVWYLACTQLPSVYQSQVVGKPMPNGHLLLIVETHLLLEVDLLGDVQGAWWAAHLSAAPADAVSVDVDSFHHDIAFLPPSTGADFAVLCTELRVLANYPSDVVDLTRTVPSANVIGDKVVEFNRDGTIVRQFKLFDLIDPYRVSYDSLGGYWDLHYTTSAPTCDWSHGNALTYSAADDCYLVSTRHQDAVFKISRTGQLVWILGDHGRWNAPWDQLLLSPTAGTEWQYHQHAPMLDADGSIYLFDNGCGRAIPPAPALTPPNNYSRAVQFRVNETQRTVEQQWAYGGPPGGPQGASYYSFYISSAYHLPVTGNVLVCDGGHRSSTGLFHGRIAEVTHATPPEVVFELYVRDQAATNPVGYSVYRAYHLPAEYLTFPPLAAAIRRT